MGAFFKNAFQKLEETIIKGKSPSSSYEEASTPSSVGSLNDDTLNGKDKVDFKSISFTSLFRSLSTP